MATSDYTPKIISRFWSRINKNGSIPEHRPELGNCWEWTSGGNGKGYGQLRVGSTRKGTHQISWELTHGEIPIGLWVLHKCDNRSCCNPDHLFLGTPKDNVSDMTSKGRKPSNKSVPRHHLTEEEKQTVKSLYAGGRYRLNVLARDFNVSYGTILNIVNGNPKKR